MEALRARSAGGAMLILLCLLGGCKSMTPGDLTQVQPYSDRPYAGNAYLLRGFIGIWSYGIDHLGQKIDQSGIRSHVYQEDQWRDLANQIIVNYRAHPDHEPLVLIGHSYGADDTLRIARKLQEQNIPVDLIVTLDPVTPPQVPGNVRMCYNIYQSNLLDSLPFFRGVKLESELPDGRNLVNVNLRTDRRDLLEPGTDHFNIEKNPLIHAEVVKKLKEVCPPRQVWASRFQTRPITASVRPTAPTVTPQASSSPNSVARQTSPQPLPRNDPRLDRIP